MDEHTASEQAYKKGYEKGKQDAVKWTSVNERLPNLFGGYLVVVQKAIGDVYTDYADYDPYQKIWRTGLPLYPGEKVILWAELPTPPKGE